MVVASAAQSGGGLRNSSKNNGNNEKASGGKNGAGGGGKDKASHHTGKENGNAFGGEHGGKHESQSSSKKFGKTPGRERKSNNQGKKGGSGSGKTLHKAQALQFSSSSGQSSGKTSGGAPNSATANYFLSGSNIPSASSLPAPPNVWGENRARFSDVVAQAAVDGNGTGAKSVGSSGTTSSGGSGGSSVSKMLNFDLNTPLERFGSVSSMNSAGTAASTTISSGSAQQNEVSKVVASLFSKAREESGYIGAEKEQQSQVVVALSSELGPIGTTKKSPSVTPKFWEPFAGSVIQRPSQLGLPQSSQMNDLTGSDSYFSQQFGDFGAGDHAYRGAQQNRSSLMDLQSSSQVNTFGGLNSHGMHAAPMVDPMADLNQMVLEQQDWDAKMFWQAMQKNEEHNQANLIDWSSLWTSPPVFPHQQQQHQPRLANNWLGGGGTATGQRSNQMPLRAPPGFSPVKPNPPTNPQQMHPHMSAMQQPSQLAHLQPQQDPQQQHQQQQDNGTAGPATYDPFRISIWTPAGSNDVWNEKK